MFYFYIAKPFIKIKTATKMEMNVWSIRERVYHISKHWEELKMWHSAEFFFFTNFEVFGNGTKHSRLLHYYRVLMVVISFVLTWETHVQTYASVAIRQNKSTQGSSKNMQQPLNLLKLKALEYSFRDVLINFCHSSTFSCYIPCHRPAKRAKDYS